ASAAGQWEIRGEGTGLLFEYQDVCVSNNIGRTKKVADIVCAPKTKPAQDLLLRRSGLVPCNSYYF
ncbi:MAG: hypothetical protein WCT30_09695, partial [Desulfurivibrionaceae bacterium]